MVSLRCLESKSYFIQIVIAIETLGNLCEFFYQFFSLTANLAFCNEFVFSLFYVKIQNYIISLL